MQERPILRNPWEPNAANYKAFIRARILAGVWLVLFLGSAANLHFKFAFPGNEKLAFGIALLVLALFLRRFPTPMQMQRLAEWKGRKTVDAETLETSVRMLSRAIAPTAIVGGAVIVGLSFAEELPRYAPYLIAGAVVITLMLVALYGPTLKKWRDKRGRD